jgi:DNA ligase-4
VGLLVYIIKKRCSDVSNMTINDVNEFLDDLSKSTSSEEKLTCMAKLIKSASVVEQKWIIYIILKDLKLGLGQDTVFKHIDSRALDVYTSTSSLVEVCNYLVDPKNSKYANSFFQLFCPIKPMLAGRMNLNDIIKHFTNMPIFIETKYDGERIQCHLKDKQCKFFTRNAVDYTYLYGPKLEGIIAKSVIAKSAILDGEVCVWDRVNSTFAPFGENKPTAMGEETEKQLVCIYI